MQVKKIISTQSLIICIFYFFKLFGLATIKFNVESTVNKTYQLSFKQSKLGFAYNLFLTGIAITTNIFGITFVHYSDYGSRKSFEKIIDTIQNTYALCTTVLILATFSCQQKKIIAMCKKITAIQECSAALATDLQDYDDSLKRDIIKTFFMFFAPWFLLIGSTANTNLFYLIVFYAGMYLCAFIITCLQVQYCVLLHFEKHVFQLINQSLLVLSRGSCRLWKFNASYIQPKSEKLQNLRELYAKLSEFTQDLSAFYSLPILVYIIHIYMALIRYGYYIIKPITSKNNLPLISYVRCYFYVLLYLISLINLAVTVTNTVGKSKRTKEIVTDCVESFENNQIDKQVKQFSSALRYKNIQFKVFNLFSLDESLLISVAGSLTTYLVIILQFNDNKV